MHSIKPENQKPQIFVRQYPLKTLPDGMICAYHLHKCHNKYLFVFIKNRTHQSQTHVQNHRHPTHQQSRKFCTTLRLRDLHIYKHSADPKKQTDSTSQKPLNLCATQDQPIYSATATAPLYADHNPNTFKLNYRIRCQHSYIQGRTQLYAELVFYQ